MPRYITFVNGATVGPECNIRTTEKDHYLQARNRHKARIMRYVRMNLTGLSFIQSLITGQGPKAQKTMQQSYRRTKDVCGG